MSGTQEVDWHSIRDAVTQYHRREIDRRTLDQYLLVAIKNWPEIPVGLRDKLKAHGFIKIADGSAYLIKSCA